MLDKMLGLTDTLSMNAVGKRLVVATAVSNQGTRSESGYKKWYYSGCEAHNIGSMALTSNVLPQGDRSDVFGITLLVFLISRY